MKSCDWMQFQLSAWMDDELETEEVFELKTHLQECEDCQKKKKENEVLQGYRQGSSPLLLSASSAEKLSSFSDLSLKILKEVELHQHVSSIDLEAYSDGEVQGEQRYLFLKQHLQSCRSCEQEYHQICWGKAHLGQAKVLREPSPTSVWYRTMKAVENIERSQGVHGATALLGSLRASPAILSEKMLYSAKPPQSSMRLMLYVFLTTSFVFFLILGLWQGTSPSPLRKKFSNAPPEKARIQERKTRCQSLIDEALKGFSASLERVENLRDLNALEFSIFEKTLESLDQALQENQKLVREIPLLYNPYEGDLHLLKALAFHFHFQHERIFLTPAEVDKRQEEQEKLYQQAYTAYQRPLALTRFRLKIPVFPPFKTEYHHPQELLEALQQVRGKEIQTPQTPLYEK